MEHSDILNLTNKYNVFNFDKFIFNKDTQELELYYSLDDKIYFKEILTFEDKINFSKINDDYLNIILKNMHLAFGISYYKTYCPKNCDLPFYTLTKSETSFWNEFYKNGLGEFCFRNNIDPNQIIKFPYDETKSPTSFNVNLTSRSLLPIGGGKDSILSANILKKLGKSITTCVMNTQPLIEECITIFELPSIHIRRTLSPNIFELNKLDALNGHVPITGCISFLLVLLSYLYDFSDIVLSLENSASEEQAYIGDFKVNHQYSKSIDFENLFINHLKENISPSFNYYSILRPLNELLITKLFTSNKLDCKKHYESFSSCNKNFRIGNALKERWCGICPKCAFVYLLFAPFLNDTELNTIFDGNFLEKDELTNTYLELLGLKEHRPFECVGSLEETIASFYLLYKQERFLRTTPIEEFIKNIVNKKSEDELKALTQNVLTIKENHFIKDNDIIKFLRELVK